MSGQMADCARQLVLEPYLVLLNDVRSSYHYVQSLKIINSFSTLINQLPSCFVFCLSSCVSLTRLTFVYCEFDMIQLKRFILFFYFFMCDSNIEVLKVEAFSRNSNIEVPDINHLYMKSVNFISYLE